MSSQTDSFMVHFTDVEWRALIILEFVAWMEDCEFSKIAG